MTFQPGANLYTQGFGSRPENVEVPHLDSRAPSTTDVLYPIGKRWIYVGQSIWELLSISSVAGVTSANWVQLADSDGAVQSVLGTANQITATNVAGTVTLSLPVAVITPGSLSTTTTLTAGTGLTVTTGGAAITGTTNINTTGAAITTIGTGGTGAVNIGNTTGNTSVTGSLTASTGLTATTGDIVASAGNANITGNVVASKSSAAANVTVQVTNSDNTSATSNAGVEIATGGSSSGDPYLSFQISGVGASTMTMGLDNSSSDTLVISNSSSIGTSNALTLTQAGALGATTSITAGTTLTATLGDITGTNGNLVLNTAGNKIIIATGSDASVGTSGVMSGTPGAVTVATTACSASAKIFYSRATTGGTPGEVSITAQDGTGFTLTSTGNETSTFNWWIINA